MIDEIMNELIKSLSITKEENKIIEKIEKKKKLTKEEEKMLPIINFKYKNIFRLRNMIKERGKNDI